MIERCPTYSHGVSVLVYPHYLDAFWSSKNDPHILISSQDVLPSKKKKTCVCWFDFVFLQLYALLLFPCQDEPGELVLLTTFTHLFFVQDCSWSKMFKIGVYFIYYYAACVGNISRHPLFSDCARNGKLSGSEDRWSLTLKNFSRLLTFSFLFFYFWKKYVESCHVLK